MARRSVVWISRHPLEKVQKIHLRNQFGRRACIEEKRIRYEDTEHSLNVIEPLLHQGCIVVQIKDLKNEFLKILRELSEDYSQQIFLLGRPEKESAGKVVSLLYQVTPDQGVEKVDEQRVTVSNARKRAREPQQYVNVPFLQYR